jgi:hypothetical protein
VQFDDAFGIFVRDVMDLGANSDVRIELFCDFPFEAPSEWFIGIALAAGELPEAGEVSAAEPPGHEVSTVALDDGRGHDDPRRLR